MNQHQLISKVINIASIIPLTLMMTTYPTSLSAQTTSDRSQVNRDRHQLVNIKFPDNGAPKGRRRGGTARGPGGTCPVLPMPITAMVPGQDGFNQTRSRNEFKSFAGTTTSEHPTFWVYIPQLPASLITGEFILQNDQGENIYKTNLTLPTQSGIIGISTPKTPEYALKTGNKYQWYFKLACGNPSNKSEAVYVDAWVEKIAIKPALETQLAAAKSTKYIPYAQNQVWYDALTDLALLRQANPNSATLESDWNSLLKSVDLEKLASAKVVQVDHAQR